MASKTSNIVLMKAQQSKKETVFNNAVNALSPAAFGGRNEDESNLLTFGVYGGTDSTGTKVANQSINLPASSTGYIYYDSTSKTFKFTTIQPTGVLVCYYVKTDTTTTTDWLDWRFPYGGGGSGGGDANFKSNAPPSNPPIASGSKSIAIGENAVASGSYSFAAVEGEASAEDAVAFGRNNKSFTQFSAVWGGVNNRIESSISSTIIGGNTNFIQGGTQYFTIINSEGCRVKNSSYAFSMILNSSTSEIASAQAMIINGLGAYMDAGSDFSIVTGRGGYLNTPYTFQMSFGGKVRKDFTGLSALGNDANTTTLITGDNQANVKRFILTEAMVMNFKITLLGIDTSNNNVVKLSAEVVAKRFNGNGSFVGEASATTKPLTLVVSEGSLSGVSATVDIQNNVEMNINAVGVAGTSIRWCAVYDIISVNK